MTIRARGDKGGRSGRRGKGFTFITFTTLTTFITLLPLLTGCQAHMMETYGDTVTVFPSAAQAPKRGGVIRYLNTGMDAWKQARRKNAEGQMQTFCKGNYSILLEGPRSKFGSGMPTESHLSFEVDQYTYLKFECEKKQ